MTTVYGAFYSGGGNGGSGSPNDCPYGPNCSDPALDHGSMIVDYHRVRPLREEEAKQNIENQYKRLNEYEKTVIRQNIFNGNLDNIYKIYDNSILASQKTIEIFGPNGGGNNYNDCGDSFRHAFWNSLNILSTNNINLSKEFADAHECGTKPEDELKKIKDLHNNHVGRNIGLYADPYIDLANLVLQALYNGELFVLNPVGSNNTIIHGITSVVNSNLLHY